MFFSVKVSANSKENIFDDKTVKMNQIQVIGTHNSYRIKPQKELLDNLKNYVSDNLIKELKYSHLPLDKQFNVQNIRQIELDIFADPEGGLFYHRAGQILLGKNTASGISKLKKPGYKVMHVPHVDYETHYITLIDALKEVKKWSLNNPNHIPIMILIEVKTDIPDYDTLKQVAKNEGLSLPPLQNIQIEDLNQLDEEIKLVFDNSLLITPDFVRGNFSTLEEAVLNKGWPTLDEARGKIFFTLDNEGEIRDLYLEDSPILKDRLLFVSSHPGEPSAAFIKINDPQSNKNIIREYVKSGFIVRTRADAGLQKNHSRKNTAFESGAQYISTDFPTPLKDLPQSNDFEVSLPNTYRLNPINY